MMAKKVDKQTFVAQCEAFFERDLTREELDSIVECFCGREPCSGWTVEVEPSMMMPILTPRLEV